MKKLALFIALVLLVCALSVGCTVDKKYKTGRMTAQTQEIDQ